MYCLENDRLKVEVAEPGTVYKGARFDWTGFISQITLDGEVTYCVPEQLEEGKGTGGLGFCNEFGIDRPVGYEKIEPGDFFLKIGVGQLRKEQEADYDFFKDYEVIPAEVKTEEAANSVEFEITDATPSGYGYHLLKEVAIFDNRLIISYKLTNTGDHPIHTNEYSHNFIGINDRFIDAAYRLTMPQMKTIDVAVGSIDRNEDRLTWPVSPEADFYASIDWEPGNGAYNWEVFNDNAQAGVRELSEFQPSKIALWGHRHVVCPEVFADISLDVDESLSWKRVYEFYKNAEN
ncbi:hypothetical protein SAMN04488102_10495 [Alkalibacterium subtropicum]|uniref:Galactose mutarotase n=1 Tax=Alkalibacterium subtropicum TaxID=753702 RepID=A0A1I1HJI5_9LACT|nr:hypothetical protein [Alkalibacterium subtropicum]SFC24124.1 hypothetical protein SAMN04488102_10495 [Alkalibacterium subtropicum]